MANDMTFNIYSFRQSLINISRKNQRENILVDSRSSCAVQRLLMSVSLIEWYKNLLEFELTFLLFLNASNWCEFNMEFKPN